MALAFTYWYDCDDYDCYNGPRTFVFTAEYVERVLQSVFHTITVIALYEIIKETFRRIELIRLRCQVRQYEMLVQNCCLRVYGCRTCTCCTQLNCPQITYRAVPTSLYRAFEGKTHLWRKKPYGITYSVAKTPRSTQEEIKCLNQYIRELSEYVRELRADQDFQIKQKCKRDELRRQRMVEELMLMALREKELCPCAADVRPSEPSTPGTVPSPRWRPSSAC